MKWLILVLMLLHSLHTQAHQTDLSTTLLIEQNPGHWIMQLSGALTAFEYEVQTNFPPDSFASKEEFEKLLIEYVKKSTEVRFNNKLISIHHGSVRLGHETNVLLELTTFSEVVQNISIINNTFKDIHNNQSNLVIIKKDYSQDPYILNQKNKYSAEFILEGGKFAIKEKIYTLPYYSYFFGIILFIPIGLRHLRYISSK